MEWIALAVVVALALAVVVALAVAAAFARAVRSRRAGTASAEATPALTPDDRAELERGFARIEQEVAGTLETLLAARLQVLVSRGVPLRAMRSAPGEHTARLLFANGTVLIGRAERPGELYALAIQVHREGVAVESWHADPAGTVVRFRWPAGSADLVVMGLDQAD